MLTSPARSKNLVSATIKRMKLPTLTVRSHMLADNAFIDDGDCEYLQGLRERANDGGSSCGVREFVASG